MKKIIPVLIAALALFSPLAYAAFSDVHSSHPNFDAITYVQEQQIVDGYKDGTYKPDSKINRAEFTKIIVNAVLPRVEIDDCIGNTVEPTNEAVFFPDVPKTEWFAKYICAAKTNGLISGYPDGTFQPGNDIKFVEAAKIISIGFKLHPGTDPVWYKPYVEALATLKAIPTTINGFEKLITRGEMAEMIYRLKAKITDKDSLTYDQIKSGNIVTGSNTDGSVNLNLMLFSGIQNEFAAAPSWPVYSNDCFDDSVACSSVQLYKNEWTLNTSNRLAFNPARDRVIYPSAAGVFQLNFFDLKTQKSSSMGLENKYAISYLPAAMDDTLAAAVFTNDQKETVIKNDLITDKEVAVSGFDSYDKCTWPAVSADHKVLAVCNKGSDYKIVEEGGTELYSSSNELASLAADRSSNLYFVEKSQIKKMNLSDKKVSTLDIPTDYKVATVTTSPFGDYLAGKSQKDGRWNIFVFKPAAPVVTILNMWDLEPGIPAFGPLIFTDSNSTPSAA